MNRFLIYAANLHVGGGVQVATSIVDELSRMHPAGQQLAVLVSTAVDRNLRAIGTALDRFPDYRVEDHHGLKTLFKPVGQSSGRLDAILVVFGPLYQFRQPWPTLVGFAQPWIIYPDNEISRRQPALARWTARVKYALQAMFFRRSGRLVVELEHVRAGLERAGIAGRDRVAVVNNCLASIYTQPDRWQPVPPLPAGRAFRLGFVGRNYPHKNTAIMPAVRDILRREFGLEVEFHVTFSSDEWARCPAGFREAVTNAGPLTVAQCPSFYQALDGVFFPSLLECFSATPLEAMAMKRPLFASDRAFNRDVCGDFAFYFDPLDPHHAASVIAGYLRNRAAFAGQIDAAHRHVIDRPGPAVRARLYLDALQGLVAKGSHGGRAPAPPEV